MTDVERKVLDWFAEGRTGASSKCIAFHLTGREHDGSYPHDSGDFGRCVGLLEAVPELRASLPRMAGANRYWAALVEHWDAVEALSGDLPAQSKAIRDIVSRLEDADPGVVRFGGGAHVRFGGFQP